MKLTRILMLLSFVVMFSCAKDYSQNRVLIIGIDGCRPDALLKANTPNIDKLASNGAYSYQSKTDEISSSGICWTGMLTGVWHDKHKVVTNDYKNPNLKEFPHFFHRLKKHNPKIRTYTISQWAPIHMILQDGDADYANTFKSEEETAIDVIEKICKEDVTAMFVQLDDVDHAGHSKGFHKDSTGYISAIESADERVGRIMRAVKSRKNYKSENWLVIVSTDHGGSQYSHGQNIPEHTTTFFIANGKDVKKGEIKEQVNVVDIACTTMEYLGLEIAPEWNLDGKAVGLK